ncbi:AAA family ATPase [Sedimentibacter saalensis]|uniref:AAA family ATPase n=1 Tax=Sedimentibacter saalensis TaxID=130788 RepID=UPI00289BAD04|nr:ATP-binding protein [Sedimentibacter saalensis]
MIRKIEIKNFKKFDEMIIDDMKSINVIVGKNSSGKTTLLEAIFTILGRLSGDVFIKMYSWRGLEEIDFKAETLVTPLFFNYDTSKEIEIKLYDEMSIRRLKIKYNPDGEAPSISQNIPFNSNFISSKLNDVTIQGEMLEYEFSYKGKTYFHKLIYGNNQLVFNNGNNDFERLIAGFISTRINTIGHESAQFFSDLKVKKMEKEVIEELKIIEPRIVDVITKGDRIYFDIGLGEYKPIEQFGDGASRLLYLIVSIAARANGLLMIDEIERGFHYSVHGKVWEAVIKTSKRYNCQLIITTHSYEILQSLVDAANITQSKDISFYKLDGSRKGKKYSIAELSTAVTSNWEVR